LSTNIFALLDKLSIRNKLIIGFCVPLLFLVSLSAIVYLSIEKQKETTDWVEHTHKVIASAQELLKLLVDMETGERGFLITGDEVFLQPYNQALTVWDQKLTDLSTLVSDNPIQVTRLQEIDGLQKLWLNKVSEVEIAARKTMAESSDFEAVKTLLGMETGKDIIDEIRLIQQQFIQMEQALMSTRQAEQVKATAVTKRIITLGILTGIFVAGFIIIFIHRSIVGNLTILMRGTKELSSGNFEREINIDTNDEFSQLANSFNSMSSSLKYSMDEMEAALQSKSDFLANMSHEIRTPMNGMLGMLTMLEDTRLTEEQTEFVKTIRSCGDGLLLVINDILDISKLEAGKLSLERRPFHLANMVHETVFLVDFAASAKGIVIKETIDNSIPSVFLGDLLRVRQILLNLLSNAIKFTEQGNVELIVDGQSEQDDFYTLRFQVKDTGIGISKENQSKLFKPFSQVDNTISRKYGGTGLGLIICAQLVKQMGGKISVESELGKGSNFTFTINLQVSELTQQEQIEQSRLHKDDNNKSFAEAYPLKILVAEDNRINQIIVKSLFGKLGYDVDIANDGQEAIDAVDNKKYDVIFMDMQMPVMDGVTATKNIIAKHPNEHPNIIAMTANVLTPDKQRCYDAGMIDFIAKPINSDHVVEAIRKMSLAK